MALVDVFHYQHLKLAGQGEKGQKGQQQRAERNEAYNLVGEREDVIEEVADELQPGDAVSSAMAVEERFAGRKEPGLVDAP